MIETSKLKRGSEYGAIKRPVEAGQVMAGQLANFANSKDVVLVLSIKGQSAYVRRVNPDHPGTLYRGHHVSLTALVPRRSSP